MSVPLQARVLLADDHEMVRDGLRLILDGASDLRVAATAEDGLEARRLALAEDFDLAVLDVSMPRMTGLQVARELHKIKPQLRVVLLSMHENQQYVSEALRAGARGYVLKSAANQTLIEACRSALRGATFEHPHAAPPVRCRPGDNAIGNALRLGPLTPREEDIVKLIAEGHTSDEIAQMLVISSKTVDRHRANVFEKLKLRNRVQLTRYAIRNGLVEA